MGRVTAYIGLGSNLGDRKRFIDDALRLLRESPGIEDVCSTEPIETEPLAGPANPLFLNSVAGIKTTLSAENLLHRLNEIENALGRQRMEKWGPRTIDLDLLLFGDEVIETDTLIVPHPQMHLRTFVLKGLCQLNLNLIHPVLNETVETLTNRLNGADFAPKTGQPLLISIAGNIGAGKTTLAKKLAYIFSCKIILEQYDTNPFLPKVYAGNHDLALDSQLYFLTSRLEQLNPAGLEIDRPVVTDYIFQKEIIYANLLLSREQLDLYLEIHDRLAGSVIEPALAIYLADSTQECLERIHSRNRPYEQKIKMSFLEAIDAGYKKLIAGWKVSPVITLTDFNCLNQNAVEDLAHKIKYYIYPQSTYESCKNH